MRQPVAGGTEAGLMILPRSKPSRTKRSSGSKVKGIAALIRPSYFSSSLPQVRVQGGLPRLCLLPTLLLASNRGFIARLDPLGSATLCAAADDRCHCRHLDAADGGAAPCCRPQQGFSDVEALTGSFFFKHGGILCRNTCFSAPPASGRGSGHSGQSRQPSWLACDGSGGTGNGGRVVHAARVWLCRHESCQAKLSLVRV